MKEKTRLFRDVIILSKNMSEITELIDNIQWGFAKIQNNEFLEEDEIKNIKKMFKVLETLKDESDESKKKIRSIVERLEEHLIYKIDDRQNKKD